MRIACCTFAPALGRTEENLARILAMLERAEADLVLFPECAVSGYAFEDRKAARRAAEPVPGRATEAVAAACAALGRTCVFGLLERGGDGTLFNAAVAVGPGGIVGRYRKAHLLHLGVDRFTAPGDLGLPVFEAAGARVGLLVCFDVSFPEAARVLKLRGAQIVLVPTNWPAEAEVSSIHAPPVRAQENHVHLAVCDRLGEEGGFRFLGRSRVLDFEGHTLAAAQGREGVVVAEIEPARADRSRVVYRPGRYELDRIAARRPELYGPICARMVPSGVSGIE